MFEITLRLDSEEAAARVFKALADALDGAEPKPKIEPGPKAESKAREPWQPGPDAEADEVLTTALTTKMVVRLTAAMAEVADALKKGHTDRGALMSALPDRSNNSIGRSLGALQRAGVAEPRFEGSDTWRFTPLGAAAMDGRVAVRIDKPIEDKRYAKPDPEPEPEPEDRYAHLGATVGAL